MLWNVCITLCSTMGGQPSDVPRFPGQITSSLCTHSKQLVHGLIHHCQDRYTACYVQPVVEGSQVYASPECRPSCKAFA